MSKKRHIKIKLKAVLDIEGYVDSGMLSRSAAERFIKDSVKRYLEQHILMNVDGAACLNAHGEYQDRGEYEIVSYGYKYKKVKGVEV